jgi:hypothetical protein
VIADGEAQMAVEDFARQMRIKIEYEQVTVNVPSFMSALGQVEEDKARYTQQMRNLGK